MPIHTILVPPATAAVLNAAKPPYQTSLDFEAETLEYFAARWYFANQQERKAIVEDMVTVLAAWEKHNAIRN